MPKIASQPPELGERDGTITVLRRNQPYKLLDLELLASGAKK